MDEKIIRPNVIVTAVLIVFLICVVGFGAWMVHSGAEINKPGQENAKMVVIIVLVCIALIQAYAYSKIGKTYLINDKGITAHGVIDSTFLAWDEISKAVFYYGRKRFLSTYERFYTALHLEANDKVAMEIMIWPVLNADELVSEIKKHLPPEKINDGGDAMLGGTSRLWQRMRNK